MEQRVYEGIWEDVARHGPDLAGRRVRLTFLDGTTPVMTLDQALAHLIVDAERIVCTLPPQPPKAGD
jgi:hypothetical protein